MKRTSKYQAKAVVTLALLLGLAALSPAPIKDPESAKHEIGQQSMAQRTQELKFNGTMGVKGSVVEKTNADGTAPAVDSDSKASTLIAARPIASDPNAVRTLSEASQRLAHREEDGGTPWLTALLLFGGAFGAFTLLRIWLAKVGPAPKSRVSV